MDQDRQIRFAIPPFFLLASLLWGAYLGNVDLSFLLKPDTAKEVLGVVAAAAVAVIPLGFLISTASISLIRLIVFLVRKFGLTTQVGPYETMVSQATYERIWNRVGVGAKMDTQEGLYAVATFDHELLSQGVHAWIMRRLSSFYVAAHSATALALAHVVAPYFHVPQSWKWGGWTVGLIVLLVISALFAWYETMRMLEFQARRPASAQGQADGQKRGAV